MLNTIIYLCLIVYSLPVLLAWLLKSIYYTYLCLIVYSLPVLLVLMLKTILHIPFVYNLHSPRLTGMDAEDHYAFFFCILYTLPILQVWMLKTTIHTLAL